jgi:DNA-binding transcriptional MerR regulator
MPEGFDPVLVSEAARILNRSSETVRAWTRQGVLKARVTSTGVRVFNRADVEEMRLRLLDEERTAPLPAA